MTNPEASSSSAPTEAQIRGFHELVDFIFRSTPEGEPTILEDGRLLTCDVDEGLCSSVYFTKHVYSEVAGSGQEITFYHVDFGEDRVLRDVDVTYERPTKVMRRGADVLLQRITSPQPDVTAQEFDDVIGDMLQTLI